MSDTVNHPQHYGGKENPYEAIKVLEARMTPAEVMGFLKGSVYTYNDRAASKGMREDFEKARWYQNRLVEFSERVGNEVLFPPTVFWHSDGEMYENESEAISFAAVGQVTAIHSNVAPFTRWVVRFPITEDGDSDVEVFSDIVDAQSFVNDMKQAAVDEAARIAAEKRAKWLAGRKRGQRKRGIKKAKPAARKRR